MRRRFFDAPNGGGDYVSVVFDKSISNPANITIEDNEEVLNSILSQFRRCVYKVIAEGEVAITYLDDSNSNYLEDGTEIASNVVTDIMVNFPEFWYKYVKIDDNRFAYRLSLSNIDGDWVHIERSLVGAYKAYSSFGKLYSYRGKTPTTNKSFNDFTSYATARGKGFQIIDFQQHCVIALMLYAKYRTRNLQAVLGVGTAYYNSNNTTGSSNATGIADTKPGDTGYVCGLGIEGVYGGIYEWVKGVIINNSLWTITDPDGSTRNVNAETANGWITNVAAENGPFFDMVPTSVGGSKTTHYSDYYWRNSVSGLVLARSYYDSGTGGGVAFADAIYDPSSTYSNYGSRLAFRGVISELKDSSAFKSL